VIRVREFLMSAMRVCAPGLNERTTNVIILGVILLILGALLDIGILYTIGGILAVIGVVLWLLGSFGRQVGPRPHYY
jgi:hypothetical protein